MVNYPTTDGMIYATIFGIDSHARTTTIAAFGTQDGTIDRRTFSDNDYAKMRKYMEGFPNLPLKIGQVAHKYERTPRRSSTC